jgi:hypothetical protein
MHSFSFMSLTLTLGCLYSIARFYRFDPVTLALPKPDIFALFLYSLVQWQKFTLIKRCVTFFLLLLFYLCHILFIMNTL